jgi:hypothetical protein
MNNTEAEVVNEMNELEHGVLCKMNENESEDLCLEMQISESEHECESICLGNDEVTCPLNEDECESACLMNDEVTSAGNEDEHCEIQFEDEIDIANQVMEDDVSDLTETYVKDYVECLLKDDLKSVSMLLLCVNK